MINNDDELLIYVVNENSDGERLDKWVSTVIEKISRSTAQKLCDDGNILLNKMPKNKNYKVKTGELFEIYLPQPKELDLIPQNIPIEIVYEDDNLLVVNKPKGMVVHPAPGNYDKTLVNALLYHCKGRLSSINGIIRPGIVHRIDKDTSGLLIVAKDDFTHISLSEQIKEHSFDRFYQAVAYGTFKQDSGFVDAPIGRHPIDRKKMCVTEKNSKQAVTHYEIVKRYKEFTHLKLKLETGRTHQIRVHMDYIGHPLAGDTVYGNRKVITELNGQCLHAQTIEFIHPITKEKKFFSSELPEYFTNFLFKLKEE
ncbi:MAG: RluA family pseudouridine synthase [Oscillospiraceae bacterium]